jgi:hypothetical protein
MMKPNGKWRTVSQWPLAKMALSMVAKPSAKPTNGRGKLAKRQWRRQANGQPKPYCKQHGVAFSQWLAKLA